MGHTSQWYCKKKKVIIPDCHLLYDPLQVERKAVLEMKLQQGTQLAEQAASEMAKHSNISLQESVKETEVM
jgi:hypothetical protein